MIPWLHGVKCPRILEQDHFKAALLFCQMALGTNLDPVDYISTLHATGLEISPIYEERRIV